MDKWDTVAHAFAKKKKSKIDWITYAGFTPEEVAEAKQEEPYLPFGIRGSPIEYRVILQNGEYIVIPFGIRQ